MRTTGWLQSGIAVVLLLMPVSLAWARASDPLVDLLAEELDREMTVLAREEEPPYFIAYTVRDTTGSEVSASFGSLTSSDSRRRRTLSVIVRVGSYRRDNTHDLRGGVGTFRHAGGSSVPLPLTDDPLAIRAVVWRETNRQYRRAVEELARVKANLAVKIAEEDASADFSRESKPEVRIDPATAADYRGADLAQWGKKVERYSRPFLRDPAIFIGQSSFTNTSVRETIVSSEGTRLANNLTYARVFVNGTIKSDDGMELPLYSSYFAFTPDGLPGDATVIEDAEALADRLARMRTAEVATPYTGPALLSGRAAAVFFHEILGHRVEGHRLRSEEEGQTFKKKLGKRILPATLDVTFDPSRARLGSQDLAGFYRFDDEGVAARSVPVVVDGVLKTFLMSRRPVESLPASNGHGRAEDGYAPVSRQSNMIISSSEPISEAALRKRLIALVKEQDKPFGLFFRDIQGGFTFTGREMPNAFNLLPIEVYRVYVDGRPDELIRGVDLVGTPLVMFSMIEAVGDRYEVFNGMCGAESGNVPVAAAAPSMLIEQVEVQRKAKSQELPPLLPRPDVDQTEKGRRR